MWGARWEAGLCGALPQERGIGWPTTNANRGGCRSRPCGPEDSGRGIARLPRAVMAELGLAEGDVIELVGKRATPARAVGPYPEDEGLEIIRLDGLQRANAEIGSGDFVEIRKAESQARAARRLRARRRRICGCRARPTR